MTFEASGAAFNLVPARILGTLRGLFLPLSASAAAVVSAHALAMKRPFILAIGLIAACAVQARDLVIENPTIRLDCTRPSSCAVTDRQTGQTIELDVDSFQVVMGDGRRLSVPSLVEVGVPTLERMAGLPAAVRISEREPGELVERRFRSADGKIAVRWTAWLRLK